MSYADFRLLARRQRRWWTTMPKGRHFAVLEQPDLFVDDECGIAPFDQLRQTIRTNSVR